MPIVKGQLKSAELMGLAESMLDPKGHRDEIYTAVATLFEHQDGAFAERERSLAADILRRLSKDVEMSVRISLAERLAGDPSAPHELILLLTDDRIEVARPVLARSPVLTDADLVSIIAKASTDHQVTIAGRPAIGETVTAALARSECEAVVIALLRNQTAKIGTDIFSQLVDRARQLSSLQEPLTQRLDLPPALAARMYVWVSGALKTALAGRYPHVAHSLAHAIDEASSALQSGKAMTSEISAKRLVEKLGASGQLRSSFLIRVLHQGQMELFEHGFAALLQMDVGAMRKALYDGDPLTVALACRAAGIDRAVFMTVFNLSRHHRQMKTALSEAEQNQIQAIFKQVEKSEALTRLKAAAA